MAFFLIGCVNESLNIEKKNIDSAQITPRTNITRIDTFKSTVANLNSKTPDTLNYVDHIQIKVDSITSRCKSIINKYHSSGSENILVELAEIFKKIDGAVAEDVSYNVTKFILENQLLCDLITGFSLLDDKLNLHEFLLKIRYSQIYFPEYCKKKNEFECYEDYKSILEEICDKK